jgi:hypothetical protein
MTSFASIGTIERLSQETALRVHVLGNFSKLCHSPLKHKQAV